MRDLPESLTFAFVEDGTLRVFADRAAAILEFEGVDVESGTVNFYDLDGAYLEPRFTAPNRQGRIFGLVKWVESGVYALVSSSSAGHDSLALALYESRLMEPNDFFSDLAQLKKVLGMRGVQVDLDHSVGLDEA